jgi:CoA:oxalate CoA-transferase
VTERNATGALAGLRVLDLTQFLSGPFCTMILGDLGADVIKVETPDGDLTRTLPPHFVGDESAYYLHVNRNKRGIVVDLKHPDGRDLLASLMRKSDVVVENFRPGVLEKLGIRYEDVAAEAPGVVWCSITGFGATGPYRDRPAYDMVVQALSGAMSLTGEPGERPVRLGVPVGDLAAGMYGAIGILAALREREGSGRGQRIDVGMLDSLVSLLSYQGAYALRSGEAPQAQGRAHDSIPTYRAFACADGKDVAVTANTERMWSGMCAALGLEELLDDPRFTTNRERFTNRDDLVPILDARFRQFPAAVVAERLHAFGVPAAAVNDVIEAVNDEHVRAREMVLTLAAADGRTIDVLGNPIRLERTGRREHTYPPRLGENAREVLLEVLGIDRDEADRLAASGVLGSLAPAG